MLGTSHLNRRQPASLPTVGGLRRVDEVRIILGAGRPIAEVLGTGHRCPNAVRVSMAKARELADAGVPLRIEYRDADTARRAS
jgi:hypothetical protein